MADIDLCAIKGERLPTQKPLNTEKLEQQKVETNIAFLLRFGLLKFEEKKQILDSCTTSTALRVTSDLVAAGERIVKSAEKQSDLAASHATNGSYDRSGWAKVIRDAAIQPLFDAPSLPDRAKRAVGAALRLETTTAGLEAANIK